MEGSKDNADTPSKGYGSSQSTEESHAAPAKVETPLENLNDTAAEARMRLRALEAKLESRRRQDDEPFFYTPPRGLQKKDQPLPLLKWPLTRGERMKELGQLSEVYSSTHQVENIMAAKAYHAQFPADEYVPTGAISFAEGKIVDEKSGLNKMKGPAWFEGCDESY